jgi:hypothetical protein
LGRTELKEIEMAGTITSKTLGDIAPYDPTKPIMPEAMGDITATPSMPVPASQGGLLEVPKTTAGTETTNTGLLAPVAAKQGGLAAATQTAIGETPTTTATDLQGKSDVAAQKILAPAGYTPAADTTVEGRMNSLLGQDSQYMQAAKASAQQAMAARGLINSTMAGEAGQSAAIKAALPIATSDAQYMQARGLADQSAAQKSLLETQQAGESAALTQVQGDVSSALSKQAAGQALTQQEQNTINEYNKATKLQAESAAYNSALSKQQAGEKLTAIEQQAIADKQLEDMRQTGANYRDQVDNEAKIQIQQMDITSNEKKAIADAISVAGQSFTNSVATIMQANVDQYFKNAAINTLSAQYKNNVNSAVLPYGVTIDWGSNPNVGI